MPASEIPDQVIDGSCRRGMSTADGMSSSGSGRVSDGPLLRRIAARGGASVARLAYRSAGSRSITAPMRRHSGAGLDVATDRSEGDKEDPVTICLTDLAPLLAATPDLRSVKLELGVVLSEGAQFAEQERVQAPLHVPRVFLVDDDAAHHEHWASPVRAGFIDEAQVHGCLPSRPCPAEAGHGSAIAAEEQRSRNRIRRSSPLCAQHCLWTDTHTPARIALAATDCAHESESFRGRGADAESGAGVCGRWPGQSRSGTRTAAGCQLEDVGDELIWALRFDVVTLELRLGQVTHIRGNDLLGVAGGPPQRGRVERLSREGPDSG